MANNEKKESGQEESGTAEKTEGQQSGANEVAITKKEYDELKERMLRMAAEFDNYKKRTKADIEGAKALGKAEAVKEILPVLDEFELAMLSISKADPALVKGIEMVFSNLVEVLSKEGLKEIETDGAFDPYKHEIVLTMKSDRKPGTILQVTKKGYTINGILIRPASVIIASGDDAKEPKDGSTAGN